MQADSLGPLVAALRSARSVLFITGAGLSADSGLPTYRGIGGLYHDRFTDEDMPIEEVLSGAMLARRPALTWKYLYEVETACRGASFNAGHRVIADFQGRFERVCVLTQNVDGLHRQAGSRNLIEIHGALHRLRCTRCAYRSTVGDYSALAIPPHCPDCAALVRPDVVLFGELLPEQAVEQYYQELSAGFDMVFSIGTTSVFPYIAEPVIDAHRRGIPTVEINPGETDVSPLVDFKLAAGAASALQQLWERLHN